MSRANFTKKRHAAQMAADLAGAEQRISEAYSRQRAAEAEPAALKSQIHQGLQSRLAATWGFIVKCDRPHDSLRLTAIQVRETDLV